ncbi:MAG: diaminopimelate decarboxylase [candidate division Zixibacteria bacterium]
MDYFNYRDGQLYCEDVSVRDLAAEYSTPLYIYSLKTFVSHLNNLSIAFGDLPHIVCYAVKSNSNLALLKTAALCGVGADIVSGGELRLTIKAGIKKERIVFSGVGKTDDEIEQAIRTGILFICAESIAEIESIAKIARKLKIKAPVAVRVNPEIDPKTHPYIATGLKESKFGMTETEAKKAFKFCVGEKWLDPVGISMHIGSQLESIRPYVASVSKIIALYKYLWKQSIGLKYIDIGGGWAAHFDPALKLPYPQDYVSAVSELLRKLPATVVAEPGRSMIGNAGILVMKVIRTKKNRAKNYCIVDAGMNDFLRPPLYGAKHRIEPVVRSKGQKSYDVVGPVCESSDFFAKSIRLPAQKSGDLLALFTAGAYGRVMGSNYNARIGAAEVAVAGNNVLVIRERESYKDLERGQRTGGISRKLIEGLEL